MEKKGGYQCPFITASLILTAASLAVGMCFFSPYWLQNIGLNPQMEKVNRTAYIRINGSVSVSYTRYYPHRGLWAQCGAECIWFWSSDYYIQKTLFTPSGWHVATQVLYAVAGIIILVCEIYARVQMCCTQKCKVILSLGILVLLSALFQIASFAVFGGGAYSDYKVISDPRDIVSKYADIGAKYFNSTADLSEYKPYIGWSFWMGVVGSMLSIVSGIFYLITYCGFRLRCCGSD